MGLQKGGVDVNTGETPKTTLTLDEFKEQFKDEHRSAIAQCAFSQMTLAMGPNDPIAKKAQEALTLISKLHPSDFKW
jgi:hypothetical protein